jgi:hypothetical protein
MSDKELKEQIESILLDKILSRPSKISDETVDAIMALIDAREIEALEKLLEPDNLEYITKEVGDSLRGNDWNFYVRSRTILMAIKELKQRKEDNPMNKVMPTEGNLDQRLRRILIEFDNFSPVTDEDYLKRTQDAEKAIKQAIDEILPPPYSLHHSGAFMDGWNTYRKRLRKALYNTEDGVTK